MKRVFLVLAVLLGMFIPMSAIAEKILGMDGWKTINSQGGGQAAAYNPKNGEIWFPDGQYISGVDKETGEIFDVKKIGSGYNFAADFDASSYFWIGGTYGLARFSLKDSSLVEFDSSDAKSLKGAIRAIKFDAAHNRVVINGDNGTTFADLNTDGSVKSWKSFNDIGRPIAASAPKIFIWKDEVWVTSNFVYRWSGSAWKTYDTSSWGSPDIIDGACMDVDGNVYVADGAIFKWDRSTEKWSKPPVTNGGLESWPHLMEIDRNGVILFEGPTYFCRIDTKDPTLTCNYYARKDLSWDQSDPSVKFSTILLNPAGDFLILGYGKWIEQASVNAILPFTPIQKSFSQEKLTFVGLFDAKGRQIVKNVSANSLKPISAGNYFARYRTESGKQIVKKASAIAR